MTPIPTSTLWIVIIGLALASYVLRFVFLGFMGGRPIAPWLMRHLRYTAVAVLPALVAPLVVWPAPTQGEPSLPHFAAAVVVFAVGYLTRNVLLALATAGVALGLLYLTA
jgi:branched-subunit amino acid transport protein